MSHEKVDDMLKKKEKYISTEEYFEREETSRHKSEYYCGEVFDMAGGTPNHNRITVNVASLLGSQLKGGPCEVFVSDLRVQVEKGIHYTYPDVMVVCGELKLAAGRSDTIVNPMMIVEVLSESTRDYDRGSKFTAYRTIKTLTDYLLIDQDSVHVEYFSKENEGIWRLREYFSMNDVVEVHSIQASLPAREIYERVLMQPKNQFKPLRQKNDP